MQNFVSVTTAAVLGVGLLAFSLPGCSKQKSPEERKKQKRLEKLRKKVELPEIPSRESFEIDRKNEDGTLKVKALVFFPKDYLGQKIETKGVIRYIGGKCDPEADKNCAKPHVEIGDDTESKSKILVVGLPKSSLAEFKPGKTHAFTGQFKKSAHGFSASHSGVLEVTEINGEKIED